MTIDDPEAMVLSAAYDEWFQLDADIVDGKTVDSALAGDALKNIRRAEAECPIRDVVYFNAVAAYRRATGRDHITGKPLSA